MAKKKTTESAKATAKAKKKAKAAAKNERKESKKVGKGSNTVDEDDLETILENMRKEWEAAHAVTEEIVEGPPSRRANATLTACPLGSHLWCIGGEYFSEDGKAYFYNDVYRYNPDKNEWRKFVSKTCPGPRSAHAVVASPVGGGKLFLFGGEFSSLYQNSFHHYRDFWCFDIATHTWDRIETKIRPSARSGCRMATWKQYIFLFGGFYDPGVRTNYLNDLWYFDTQEYHWRQIEFRDTDRRPSPRSGFSFLPTPDGIVLYGGYCKEYSKGKRPVGVMLDDCWFLRISPPSAESSAGNQAASKPTAPRPMNKEKKATSMPFEAKWERRKKTGYAPGKRVGCTMAIWPTRQMGVLFGGVTDEDTNEETLTSVYHSDMFGYQLQGNGRWVSLGLRKPKKSAVGKRMKQKSTTSNTVSRSALSLNNNLLEESNNLEDEDDSTIVEEPIMRQTNSDNRFDMSSSTICSITRQDITSDQQNKSHDDPEDPSLTVPRERYGAMLAVQKNVLFIYGGIIEMGSKEFTLDDFYSIQLDKLDRFNCLNTCSIVLPQKGEVLSSDDDDDDGDDDDTDYEDLDSDDVDTLNGEIETSRNSDRGDSDNEQYARKKGKKLKGKTKPVNPVDEDEDDEDKQQSAARQVAQEFLGDASATQNAEQSEEDKLSTPLPGETLAMFYARSREYWAGKAHTSSDNKGKLLRRDGFGLAQDRYTEYKPILEEVEKILAEAGLDEDEIKRGAAAGPKALQGENRNRR